MINCTMDAIFSVSVKIVDFALEKRQKGPFPTGCSVEFGEKKKSQKFKNNIIRCLTAALQKANE